MPASSRLHDHVALPDVAAARGEDRRRPPACWSGSPGSRRTPRSARRWWARPAPPSRPPAAAASRPRQPPVPAVGRVQPGHHSRHRAGRRPDVEHLRGLLVERHQHLLDLDQPPARRQVAAGDGRERVQQRRPCPAPAAPSRSRRRTARSAPAPPPTTSRPPPPPRPPRCRRASSAAAPARAVSSWPAAIAPRAIAPLLPLQEAGRLEQVARRRRLRALGASLDARRSRATRSPVATTVTHICPASCSSTDAPKMMLVRSSDAARTISAASFTSCSDRSLPPEIESRMPRAPRTSWSISGLLIARVAASAARFGPVDMPMPIIAVPASDITARTSAKSRLISPGSVIRSQMPCTPWRSTSSAIRNASTSVVPFSSTSSSRSLGITITVSDGVAQRRPRRPATAARGGCPRTRTATSRCRR